jgi:hypothetical protein
MVNVGGPRGDLPALFLHLSVERAVTQSDSRRYRLRQRAMEARVGHFHLRDSSAHALGIAGQNPAEPTNVRFHRASVCNKISHLMITPSISLFRWDILQCIGYRPCDFRGQAI